jgi:radical SAM protein with 4Fe4S-binding SPASM domain
MGEIPEVSYAQFLSEIGASERRLPVDGTLETTYRCNLNCVHCYVNEPAGSRAARERELPLSRLKALIDEIVEAGCLNVLMTGGEVLVRPDFPELYLYAIRKGLRVTIFTNGTLVTDAVADLLDAYRPLLVEISLYGMTRETFEKVTRVPGSFEKCLGGIERLRARGIPLALKTMALTWNLHEIDAMRDFAHSLGLPFRHDGLLNPRVDCGANRNGELQLTPDQVVALDLADPARATRLKEICDEALKAENAVDGGEFVYSCGAGENTFTVDPYGQLQLCQLSRRNGFDLRSGSFETGWSEHFPKLRARKWQKNAVCQKCSLIGLCVSCPGAAELEHGDVEGVVAHFCAITHLRVFSVSGEAPGHVQDASCCLGRADAAPPSGGCSGCGTSLIQVQRARPAAAKEPA